MNDNQIKEKKTLGGEFMIQLRTVVSDFLSNDDFQEAYRFVRTFEGPLLSGELIGPQEYLDEMKKCIVQAKWVALPLLKESEIIEMFHLYISYQYGLPGLEYDLWGKVRTYLITLKVFQDRDDMRKKIREALFDNNEIITSSGPVGDTGKVLSPSVANWLRDYNKEFGSQSVDAIKINVYLNRHPVISKLPPEEMERLRKLFNFFEIMKISSLDPEGYEENFTLVDEKLGPGIVRAGRFEPIDQAGLEDMKEFIKKMKELKIPPFDKEESGQMVSGDMADQRQKKEDFILDKKLQTFLSTQIITNTSNIKKQLTGKDLKFLRSHFYQAVNGGKTEEAVAALFLMAEMGKLQEAFAGDERFVKFWGDYLAKNKLGKDEFDKNPANEKDLARFLQYILTGRLKMKNEEAVMIGVLAANLARGAGETVYKTLAYGDMESGEFRWNV